MSNSPDRIQARRPTLHDIRGGRHLLVWGDIHRWMVVDDELAWLLERLDGGRAFKAVVRGHAKRWRKPAPAVRRELAPILRELESRGIVTRGVPAPYEVEPERVSIANLTINLTNRCNLRCSFCYNAERESREMPAEALMDAIEAGREVLDRSASFIILGGEPLLDRERLFTALDRAVDLFEARPLVSTNGTLLTKGDTVEQLARRRVEVQVSIDSHDAARHDAARGRGVHARAVEGVRRLVEAGVYTILSMVYTRQTTADMQPYLEMAADLGVREARFIPLRMIGGGLSDRSACPDQAAALRQMLDVLARRPELRRLLARDYFTIQASICRTSTPRTSCGVGRKVLFIDADGAVYPCPNHLGAANRCGHLAEQQLADIVRHAPAMQQARERYRVVAYPRCAGCAFRYWCAGDCRGEVVAACGDPTAPSPHCDELKEMYTELLWLIADGDPRLGAPPGDDPGQRAVDTFVT